MNTISFTRWQRKMVLSGPDAIERRALSNIIENSSASRVEDRVTVSRPAVVLNIDLMEEPLRVSICVFSSFFTSNSSRTFDTSQYVTLQGGHWIHVIFRDIALGHRLEGRIPRIPITKTRNHTSTPNS